MVRAGRRLAWRFARSVCCGLAVLSAISAAQAAEIISAEYNQPTSRYKHGVLGDTIEYGGMVIRLNDGSKRTLTLPKTRVFEDIKPRLTDVDQDGTPEIIAVESSLTLGARFSIFDETGLVAATPYIGRAHRWLAPIGAADLDGDGNVEIAYIDRPHLAKTLRIWRFSDQHLSHVADIEGFTNHRIGWALIPGGIRECGYGPQIVVATSDWSEIAAIQFSPEQEFSTSIIGNYDGPNSLNAALSCP